MSQGPHYSDVPQLPLYMDTDGILKFDWLSPWYLLLMAWLPLIRTGSCDIDLACPLTAMTSLSVSSSSLVSFKAAYCSSFSSKLCSALLTSPARRCNSALVDSRWRKLFVMDWRSLCSFCCRCFASSLFTFSCASSLAYKHYKKRNPNR